MSCVYVHNFVGSFTSIMHLHRSMVRLPCVYPTSMVRLSSVYGAIYGASIVRLCRRTIDESKLVALAAEKNRTNVASIGASRARFP